MHSAGLELTKLTYTRLEDNLIRHRGDRLSLCNLRETYQENVFVRMVGANSRGNMNHHQQEKRFLLMVD